jgi:hypothetical protein
MTLINTMWDNFGYRCPASLQFWELPKYFKPCPYKREIVIKNQYGSRLPEFKKVNNFYQCPKCKQFFQGKTIVKQSYQAFENSLENLRLGGF